jgi:serine/threonine-protein kinase
MDLDPDFVKALAGRYEFERELGHGGMAIVYLARDIKHDRPVALKVLRPELAASLGAERFLREIAITASLVHPNILALYDSDQASGSLYYVMPYVNGPTLGQRLKREAQLPIDDALAITRQIAAALDYAHARGVIHRDIKPDNILFLGDHVLVADFGLARAISSAASTPLTDTRFVVGTALYMSPEQCTPGRAVDARSDIYSLGCVVFEMITGVPPFRGATADATMTHHLTSDPPSLLTERRSCPSTLDDVVKRALAKAPADRFRTAGEFVRALESPRPIPLPPPVTPGRSFARRPTLGVGAGKWLRWLGYAALGAAAIVAVAATVTLNTKRPIVSSGIPDGDPRRVAVLYFDDLTPDKHLGHIAAGLTENLIDQLSQVPALRVISPNGVRVFRNTDVALDTVARRLNAGTIIGGSISSSGALLRVTVRLIDARTGGQLNSRTLEHPLWNMFRLQDTLTTDVALWLREHLGRQVRLREQLASTSSVPAWELVQRGEDYSREASALVVKADPRASALFRRADSAFVAAEALDPKWPVPNVSRARNAISAAFVHTDRLARPTPLFAVQLHQAVGYADRALSRQPIIAEALAIRGEARMRLVSLANVEPADSLLALAEADLERAAAERPDAAKTWSALGVVRYRQGRFSEAADAFQTAYDTDAFLTNIRAVLSQLFFANLLAGRFDDARRWCRLAQSRYPGDVRFTQCELYVLGWAGSTPADAASAWRLIGSIEGSDSAGLLAPTWSFRRMMVAAVLARAKLTDSARAVIARTHTERGDKATADQAEAHVQLLLGDRDEALRLLARVLAASPNERTVIANHPWFRDLQGDNKFSALIERH